MSANGHRYNVGGILLDRPFKIRRLGHFGFNVDRYREGAPFLRRPAGLHGVRHRRFLAARRGFRRTPGSATVTAISCATAPTITRWCCSRSRSWTSRADRQFAPEVTINQITWQCGSLKEIVEAYGYFEEQQVRIQRVGRDMPGSNWHTYVYDPDGHTNELYYGIEQVGWNQESKPRAMYYRGFREKPELPQMSEAAEIAEAHGKGIDIFSGHRPALPNGGKTYDVDGVLLPRPFKITKIGPVRLFVEDVDRAEAFYTRHLGLTKSEESVYRGARCVFLRTGAEHHSLALYPKELRGVLGLSPHTTCLSFGVELANYAQLREAVAFPEGAGLHARSTCRRNSIPASTTRRSRSTRTGTASSSITTWSRSAGTEACGPPPSAAA